MRKTHLRQGRRVLRSKTAEMVRQVFYGWVLAHYAVRWLLHEGTARSGQTDAKLSFTRHVHLVRRDQPRSGAFPPVKPIRHGRWLRELLQASACAKAVRTLDQQRRRMVKRRNSPYDCFKLPRTKTPFDLTPVLSAPAGSRNVKTKRAVKNEFITN